MLLEVTMAANNIWECILLVFGGLGVFLYGINLMGDALKDLAGSKLKMIIEKSTSTPLRGILIGAGLTAIIIRNNCFNCWFSSFWTYDFSTSGWYYYGGKYWYNCYFPYYWF